MPQKKKADQTKVILSAAMSLADKTGWGALTLEDIARKAKIAPAIVHTHFPDTWAILKEVLLNLDAQTSSTVKKNLSDIWRDDLFEILMTRFDIMEEHRGCFSSINQAFLSSPQSAPPFLRDFATSMHDMLTLAKAPDSPPAVLAFGAVYLSLVETWKNDDTPDLAKTMAAVDKRLNTFENMQKYLRCPINS